MTEKEIKKYEKMRKQNDRYQQYLSLVTKLEKEEKNYTVFGNDLLNFAYNITGLQTDFHGAVEAIEKFLSEKTQQLLEYQTGKLDGFDFAYSLLMSGLSGIKVNLDEKVSDYINKDAIPEIIKKSCRGVLNLQMDIQRFKNTEENIADYKKQIAEL